MNITINEVSTFLHALDERAEAPSTKLDAIESKIHEAEIDQIQIQLSACLRRPQEKLSKIPKWIRSVAHRLIDPLGVKKLEKESAEYECLNAELKDKILPALKAARDHLKKHTITHYLPYLSGLAVGLTGVMATSHPVLAIGGALLTGLVGTKLQQPFEKLPEQVFDLLAESASDPKEGITTFLQGIKNFDKNPHFAENIYLPEGTIVKVDGNRCKIVLPETAILSYFYDPKKNLTEAQYKRFNKMSELGALKDINKPTNENKPLPKKLTTGTLKSFRSIPSQVISMIKGKHLNLAREIVLEKSEIGVTFVKGAPTIRGIKVSKIDFEPSSPTIDEQEGGLFKVHIKCPGYSTWDRIFLSDLSDLFNVALTPAKKA